ncbi:hypothetical protein ACFWNL_18405 [Kitasatospora sp. NPDC058397]|uniref:hypothetical protein n=1 Tax=unclassified Kitasatospora TaxID=2633591 RepID=UPI0036468129
MSTDTEIRAAYARAQQQSADDPGRCVVPWGVCPDHGPTLRASVDRTTCTDLGCLRVWGFDRLDAPCPEPATHTVRADDGGRYGVCDGHAIAARAEITGAEVVPGQPDSV